MDGVPVTTLREVLSTGKVPRRRVEPIIKKHLEQKYLLCGFAIHAFLASPVYLYGILVDSHSNQIMRIWPAVLYQAFSQVCQSFLQHSADQYHGKSVPQIENRRIILISTIITCIAITASGFLFSPSWIKTTTATEIIAAITYGLFGGIGSSIILTKTHIILEAVRPKEDKYVRKTIHLCGEAFCQLFLSFVISSLRTLYGTSLAIFLSGPFLLNLTPLGLLVSKKITQQSFNATSKSSKKEDSRYEALPGFFKIKSTEQLDKIELHQKNWKSPHEVHCNYMAVTPEEAHVAYINPNGVEIMEIIPEEDENTSNMLSSSITIHSNSQNSIDDQVLSRLNETSFQKIQQFYKYFTDKFLDIIIIKLVNPLKRAVVVPAFYPSMFLQSADVFSYVMCMTVLPSVAIDQHQLKIAEIPFLFSLLAFPWMCFALMTPRFGNTLIKKKIKWHFMGCTSKALAFFLISISSSKLLLSVATVFLGFGQAVTMFLQDLVIQSGVQQSKWLNIKYTMYTSSGLLVTFWGGLSQLVIMKHGFQASVSFVASIYMGCVLLWYTMFLMQLTKKWRT